MLSDPVAFTEPLVPDATCRGWRTVPKAGHGRARLSVGLLLATLLFVQTGCGDHRAVVGPGCELTIVIDKEFLKHHSPYQAWPDLGDLFDHMQVGVLKIGDDPRAAVFVLLVAVPVVAVGELTGLAYHNLHGVQISLTVSGDGERPLVPVSASLHWGENRVVIPESALAPFVAGSVALHIDALGTREAHLRLPIAGMDWLRAAHTIALAADGRLMVDGQEVEAPEAGEPEPELKLGPLRGRL